MSRIVSLAGVAHTLPTSNDVDWGKALSDFLAALPAALGAVLHFGAINSYADGAVRYMYTGGGEPPLTQDEIKLRVPVAGRVSALYVQAVSAPATHPVVFVVRKNGTDTTLTASLAAGTLQAADATHSFTVAAGDCVSVKCTQASGGTPTAELIVTMLLSGG